MKRNILFVLCLAISTTLAAAPNVVVSIMPLHGIVSDVMENVGEPALILKRNDSPHDYALRPSDARLMAASDLVIWVGPELEGFLRKPIANIADRAQLLTLAERQLPVVLSYKQGHGHDHDHGHGSSDDSDDHNDSLFDPHIWLSTENAIYIAHEVARKLSEMDAHNKVTYHQNASNAEERYEEVSRQLNKRFKLLEQQSFLAIHNAFSYFSENFGLNFLSHSAVDGQLQPGLESIREMRKMIVENGIRCVFIESRSSESLVDVIGSQQPLQSILLDPIGMQVNPGTGAWDRIMNSIADTIFSCAKASDQ
jgi:zinc transport system substrate-binding protein